MRMVPTLPISRAAGCMLALALFPLATAMPATPGGQVGAVEPDGPVGPRPVPGWPVILGNGIHGSAAVADVDGDGRDELAVAVRDGQIFLLDGRGRPLPGWPTSVPNRAMSSPLLEDIDGDGDRDVAVACDDGFVHAWRLDGRRLPGWPVDLGAVPVGAPRLATPDEAGGRALLVAGRDGRVHLLGPRGAALPGWPRRVDPPPARRYETHPVLAVDLDADGRDEVLCLSYDPAAVHAWDAHGQSVPGFPIPLEGQGIGLAVDAGHRPARIACAMITSVVELAPDGRLLRRRPLLDAEDRFSSPPFYFAAEPDADAPALLYAATESGAVYLWEEDRLLPGWPIRLGGFIYGLAGAEESFDVKVAPGVRDLDGDGRVELLIGCQDQHLYGFDLEGRLLPGWPLVLDDGLEATPVFAQLDGTGPEEMVVGQIGESLFAFHLAMERTGREPRAGLLPVSDDRGEWPSRYTVVALLVALLVLLIARRLGSRPAVEPPGRATRIAVVAIAGLVVVRLALLAGEVWRYHEVRARLAELGPVAAEVLADQRDAARGMVGTLAAELAREGVPPDGSPLALLYHLEQLADRHRLDDRHVGLMVADADGRVRQAFGLSRGWRTLAPLAEALAEGRPAVLADVPVVAAEAPLASGSGASRLILVWSLLQRFPQLLADFAGYSVRVVVDGRSLAYGGASPRPGADVSVWAGRVEPSWALALLAGERRPRLVLRFSQEDFQDPRTGWIDLGLLLLLPVVFYQLVARRPLRAGRAPGAVWLPAVVLVYGGGWWLLAGGTPAQRPVPLGGHLLEFTLHLAGLVAFALALRLLVGSRRGRRLSFALLGSYLVVGLLPLAVLLTVITGLFQETQRRVLAAAVADLEMRADNLLLAYQGNWRFVGTLHRVADELMPLPSEVSWYNFVQDQQLLFTYDLPSAYITLRMHERSDPGRFFSGYSYRAPRTEKFYARCPAWTGGRNLQGLFLGDGEAVVRAIRTLRTTRLEGQLIGHVPLDRSVHDAFEARLRLLPVLPRVALEPAWRPVQGPSPAGHRLPLGTRLVLPARDWETGQPRWIVYRAQAVLPPGGEMWRVLLPSILLLLLPLGLSVWGAWTSYQRTVRPLARLLTGIRRVETGDLDYRLGDTGRSEIAAAARAFDRMAESLRTTVAELAEKKKVEEVSALKSRFISMVSHDLKTPLAAIKGAAENVLGELAGPVTDRQRTYLQMILSSSENLQKMIADILDLSRLESGHLALEPEQLDLRRETDNVLRSLGPLLEERGIELRFACETDSTSLFADRTRLWQVLGNVVSNGIGHSPQGGVLEVRIEDAAGPGGEPLLAVRVLDEGPGVPDGERERIFEPFYARPAGPRGHHGAGLGLAIVRQLVQLHGGQVWLENRPAGGACFGFTLPRGKADRRDGAPAQG